MSKERARVLVDEVYSDCDSMMDPGDLIDELGELARADREVLGFMVDTLDNRTRTGSGASLGRARRYLMVSLARTQEPGLAAEFGKQLVLPDDGTSTEVLEIRNAAAFALGRLGCKEAISVLEEAAAAGHAYDACREALKKLREQLGAADQEPKRSQPELDAELLAATERGDKAAVQGLLEEGASVAARHPEWHQTPLSIASWAASAHDTLYVEIMERLMARGAEVQVGNREGWTPLHLSAYHGLASRAKVLVEHGADKTAGINGGHFAGQTPLDLARSQGKQDVVGILDTSRDVPSPAPEPKELPVEPPVPEQSDEPDLWPPPKKWWQLWK
ncbi:MAG: ankyrin repeat domain-containing protein [Pseudomonadota bacterium]